MTTDSREQALDEAWRRMNEDDRDEFLILLVSMGVSFDKEDGWVVQSNVDPEILRSFEDKMIEKYVKTN